MHSAGVVVGPCTRDVEKSLQEAGGDLGRPCYRGTSRNGKGDRREGRENTGEGEDRCGMEERRVDVVEREKRQALGDPF